MQRRHKPSWTGPTCWGWTHTLTVTLKGPTCTCAAEQTGTRQGDEVTMGGKGAGQRESRAGKGTGSEAMMGSHQMPVHVVMHGLYP